MYKLLLCTAQIDCGIFEDAKDALGSFKLFVDVPLSRDFKKAHRFIAFGASFLKRTVPFAELFATALKIGLEEDQLEALLSLTNGIDAKVSDIGKQQKYIESSSVYRDLLLNYRTNVDKVLGSFLRQIDVMSRMRMNVPRSLVDTFVHECNGLNSPRTVAQFLAKLVQDCGEPRLSTAAVVQIFKLISAVRFNDYAMSPSEQKLFFEHFAVVFFWLSLHPEKSILLEKFAEDRQVSFVQNKRVLLYLLMDELGIGAANLTDTLCLPKSAFVSRGYKRDSVERFFDLLMEHLTSLEYVTVMCANVTFYGEPEKAEVFTLGIDRILEPVRSFVGHWFDDLLNSTWPTTESLLMRNIVQDLSGGVLFSRSNATYQQIVEVVHQKMESIGHPSYLRQYVATTQQRRDGTDLSEFFAFACRPNTCTNLTTMGANLIAIRTNVGSNQAYEALQDLIEFRNASWPIYFAAMNEELYRYNFVTRAIQVLATKYDLNFNQFVNHSSYILIRNYEYPKGCSNYVGLKYNDGLNNSFLQFLYYQENGTKFTYCEAWLTILGF